MTPDNFYWYASIAIFIPWIALMFFPNWKWTDQFAFICALVLVAASTWFTFVHLTSPAEDGGHLLSFDGLKNLFRSSDMLLTGWLNYLAFCLLVGVWESHDAHQQKIPHIFVVPCLLLTMVGGAIGLVVYMLIRFVRVRKWDIS